MALRMSSLVVTLFLAVAVTAYTFPKDLANGNYSVFIKDGNTFHTSFDLPTSTSSESANTTASYVFPPDLKDGAYNLLITSGILSIQPASTAGKRTSTPARTVPAISSTDGKIEKRQFPYTEVHCYPDYYFWSDNLYGTNGAWGKFWNECNGAAYQLVSWNKLVRWSEKGNAAGFECAYDPDADGDYVANCAKWEWSSAVDMVGAVCRGGTDGWAQGGWLSIPSWSKTYGITNNNVKWNTC